jgi:hypothetical protein
MRIDGRAGEDLHARDARPHEGCHSYRSGDDRKDGQVDVEIAGIGIEEEACPHRQPIPASSRMIGDRSNRRGRAVVMRIRSPLRDRGTPLASQKQLKMDRQIFQTYEGN